MVERWRNVSLNGGKAALPPAVPEPMVGLVKTGILTLTAIITMSLCHEGIYELKHL
jgi:hypothetical protein